MKKIKAFLSRHKRKLSAVMIVGTVLAMSVVSASAETLDAYNVVSDTFSTLINDIMRMVANLFQVVVPMMSIFLLWKVGRKVIGSVSTT